jgi:hypothetical protein
MSTNAQKRARQRQLVVAALIAGAAAIGWITTGCHDATTATSPLHANTARTNLLGPQNDSLFVCAADSVVAADTATIGVLGGTLAFGPNRLTIPPGALLTPTTITASTPADGHLSAVLQPTGLRFILPATLSLGYSQCNPQPSNSLSVVYLNGPLGEILQWLPSILHLDSQTVTALIGHFSVYAAAERK